MINLASLDDVIVKAAVSENLIRFQRKGLTVPVTLVALDDRFQGEIAGFAPEADRRSKSVTLKIAIPYRDGMLRNMSATVSLPASEKRSLHVIPRDAVVRLNGKDFVYTLKEGSATMVPVQIVTRSGEFVGVSDLPIEVGMPVVIDGNDRLRPGQAAQIIE